MHIFMRCDLVFTLTFSNQPTETINFIDHQFTAVIDHLNEWIGTTLGESLHTQTGDWGDLVWYIEGMTIGTGSQANNYI